MAEGKQEKKLNFEWIKYHQSENQISYLTDFLDQRKICHLNAKELSFLNLEELNSFFNKEKQDSNNAQEEIKNRESQEDNQNSEISKDLTVQEKEYSEIGAKSDNQNLNSQKNYNIYDITNNQLRTIVKFGNIGIHYKYYSKKKKKNRGYDEEDKDFIDDDEEDQGARGLYFFETQYDDYYGFSGRPQQLIYDNRTLTNEESKLIIRKQKEMPKKKIKYKKSKNKKQKQRSLSQNQSKNKANTQTALQQNLKKLKNQQKNEKLNCKKSTKSQSSVIEIPIIEISSPLLTNQNKSKSRIQ